MDLQEQIRYYSALASHFRRLNYQLQTGYKILYASPLQEGKKGLAHDINDAYAERWENINDSLDRFEKLKRGEYQHLETRYLQSTDSKAATINHDAFVIY